MIASSPRIERKDRATCFDQYTFQNSVDSSVSYPRGFATIDLNGVDITSNIKSGKIGALIELRDEILVGEQEKLDEYSCVLKEEINPLHNQGSSLPARLEMAVK